MITVALLALAIASPEPADVTRRYALVIGVNKPAKEGQKPLRYADDDAVRFHSVFREVPGETALFSLLDEETQKAYPEAVAEAELPNKQQIMARIDHMFERMRSDQVQGKVTEFYLVYSGHGYADAHGEGNLGLHGGTFSRTDLYERVLARSPASVNHVIIDACDAYFFVQSRGDGEEDIDQILNARARDFLNRQTLSHYPNTGAILSTASAAETHEWSEIRGGVFSHSVRSGILGAADADANGSISYEEIESFVLAANAGVEHVNASRAIFVSAPATDRKHPVLPLTALGRARSLALDDEASGRMAITDARGRRYLDLNKAKGFALSLRLLPGESYFIQTDGDELAIPAGDEDLAFGTLERRPQQLAARGAGISDAYGKGLFSVPYGPQLVNGFRLRRITEVEVFRSNQDDGSLNTAGWVIGGISLATLGAAAGTFAVASSKRSEYTDSATRITRVEQLDGQIRTFDTATATLVGVGATLAVTSIIMLIVDGVSE